MYLFSVRLVLACCSFFSFFLFFPCAVFISYGSPSRQRSRWEGGKIDGQGNKEEETEVKRVIFNGEAGNL